MAERVMTISEWISDFLRGAETLQKDYEWALEEETRQERLTQDYLHMLELSEMSYHDRAKLAERIKDCRKKRRIAKDMIALLEPVTEFFSGERGKMLTGQLQQVLGKVRKVEKNINLRTYTPKVLTKEEFDCIKQKESR